MMTATLTEDSDGQLLLPFDLSTLNQMGWDIGDELEWEIDNQSAIITKKEDK